MAARVVAKAEVTEEVVMAAVVTVVVTVAAGMVVVAMVAAMVVVAMVAATAGHRSPHRHSSVRHGACSKHHRYARQEYRQ